MRRLRYLSVVIFSTLLFALIINSGCGKGGSTPTPPTPPPVAEVDLVVTTNPAFGSNLAPAAIANGLPLTVTISSVVPSGGVKIEITAKLETASTDFFTGGDAKSTVATNNYTIINIPAGGEACICTVKVTSLLKPTNTWIGTFRFARK
jgi:hypothetical protein